MNDSTERESTKFPPSSGDFPLLCGGDGVVCYFPRHILEYMSPFFRDLFSLPPERPNNDLPHTRVISEPVPLQLTERSEIIELMLEHIDPKRKTPSIDVKIIGELLEAARKYQLSTIMDWFEEEVKVKKIVSSLADTTHHSSKTVAGPLVATHPVLILTLAERFDLPETGQLALKEFTRCDANTIRSTDTNLPLRLYMRAMELRESRIEFYQDSILQLTRLEMIDSHTYDTSRKTCALCSAEWAAWIFRLHYAVRKEPSWASFLEAYESSRVECSVCRTESWPDYFRERIIEGWGGLAKEAVIEEAKIPSWPF